MVDITRYNRAIMLISLEFQISLKKLLRYKKNWYKIINYTDFNVCVANVHGTWRIK